MVEWNRMSRHDGFIEALGDTLREAVLQKEPYPVIAPSSAAGVVDTVNIAVQHGYVIMPLPGG